MTGSDRTKRGPLEVQKLSFPIKITSIEPQKRTAGRFSIFIDAGFLLGISTDTLLKSGLRKGDLLDRGSYERLVSIESTSTAKSYLLDLISRRDHARKELRDKARRKGFENSIIEPILEDLSERGILDENRFIHTFIRRKVSGGRWGPMKVRGALRELGIKPEQFEPILSEWVSESDPVQECVSVLLKKKWYFLRIDDPKKRRVSMLSHLIRKGFVSEDASKAVTKALQMF